MRPIQDLHDHVVDKIREHAARSELDIASGGSNINTHSGEVLAYQDVGRWLIVFFDCKVTETNEQERK